MMKWFLAFVVLAVASNALVLTRQGALDVTDDDPSSAPVDADADVQGVLGVLTKVEAAQDKEVSAIQTYASSKSDLLSSSLSYLQAKQKDVETNIASLHDQRKAIAAQMAPVAAVIKKLTAAIATLTTQLASANADVSRDSVSTTDEDTTAVSLLAKSSRITRRATPTNSSSTSKKNSALNLMKRLLQVLKALKARNPSPAEASNVLSKLKLASLIQSRTSQKPLKLAASFVEDPEDDSEDDPETLKTLVVVQSILDEAGRRCKAHEAKFGSDMKAANDTVHDALSGVIQKVQAMVGTMQNSGVDAAQDIAMQTSNTNEGAVQKQDDGTLVIKPAAAVDPGAVETTSTDEVSQKQEQVSNEAQNIQANLDLIAQETQKAVAEQKRVALLKTELARRDAILTRLEKFNAAKDKNTATLQASQDELTKRGQAIQALLQKDKRMTALIAALTSLQTTLASNAQKRVQAVQDEKAGVDQVVTEVQAGPTEAPTSEYGASVQDDVDADLAQLLSPDSTPPTIPPADSPTTDSLNLNSLLGDDATLLG